ncbi:MAG: helicase, partial [Acutalibacteraceae bacterium]
RAIIIDHVGKYARHGMPDDDRQWSLEKKKRTSKKKEEAQQASRVSQCPECFFTFASPPPGSKVICPKCGYIFPARERNIEFDTETKLIKVESFRLDFSSPDDCQTYQDLLQYAKKHGYKPGWAFYHAKRRGMIA